MTDPTHILVGFVDTPGGHDALALGVALADLQSSADLTVAAVRDAFGTAEARAAGGAHDDGHQRAELDLVAARQAYSTRPRTSFTTCGGASPSDGLRRLGDELHATTIVVGTSHRHGAARLAAGSTTEDTLHGARAAIAVAPPGFADRQHPGLGIIGIAYNGSPEAQRALGHAAAIATAADAQLRIFGVVEQNSVWYGGYLGPVTGLDLRDYVAEQLHGAAQRVVGDTIAVSTQVLQGDATKELATAGADCDLLVLGSRSYGPVRRALLGSVSTSLVRSPPCALLVIPRTADATADDGRITDEPSVISAAGRLL